MTEPQHAFGIEYTPAAAVASGELVEASRAKRFFAGESQDLYVQGRKIDFVRVQWTDYTSIVRHRILPVRSFLKIVRTAPRPSVAVTKATLGMVDLRVAEGFPVHGEYLLRIDLSTLRAFPSEERVAVVLGWLEEKTPLPDGSVEVGLCPRTILKRVTEQAKSTAGVEFLVGFETEFILLSATDPVQAVSHHGWTTSAALPTGSVQSKVLREIAECLEGAGVEVLMYHAEAAPGQYEIVTGPLLPLAAADALIHTRETIHSVAAKHGLRATFAPRVYMHSTGSSMHTHISVHRSGVSPSQKPVATMSEEEQAFVQGILDELPHGLVALTLPTPASFRRVQDGVWSGGTHVCWGTESRESPVRLANATSPRSRNFELRFVDGTANPYLVLAAFVGVGARAVAEKRQLRVQDAVLVKDGVVDPRTPAQFTQKERAQLGITQRLPLSWEESRKQFAESKVVKEIFGEEFVRKYLSVNQVLAEFLGINQDAEGALKKLVEFY